MIIVAIIVDIVDFFLLALSVLLSLVSRSVTLLWVVDWLIMFAMSSLITMVRLAS